MRNGVELNLQIPDGSDFLTSSLSIVSRKEKLIHQLETEPQIETGICGRKGADQLLEVEIYVRIWECYIYMMEIQGAPSLLSVHTEPVNCS